MSSNILITGANGFIGSHMVYDLCNQSDMVVAVTRDGRDDLWTKTALSEAVKVRIDLNQCNALEKLKRALSYYHIERIYHFASQAIVQRARQNPLDTYMTNVMGTAKILEAAKYIGDIPIIYMSTDKVYGEGHRVGTKNCFEASEPYSSSKICAELVARDYQREFDMNITIIRSCNVIGYDPYNLTRIVPSTIVKLMSGGTPIIYEKASERQYIYIDDAVELIKIAMGSNRVFNLGSPYICSPKEIITTICRLMDKPTKYGVKQQEFHEITKQSMEYDPEFKYTSIGDALVKTIERFETYYRCI